MKNARHILGRFVLATLVPFALSACLTLESRCLRRFGKIHPGMTREEVIEHLGQPTGGTPDRLRFYVRTHERYAKELSVYFSGNTVTNTALYCVILRRGIPWK